MMKMIAFSLNPAQISQLGNEFHTLDVDKSGCISIGALQRSLKLSLPTSVLRQHSEQIDNISSKGLNLSTFSDWMAVKCPKCSKDATRETDTFDTFFESSWYFARFAGNSDKEMISKEANYWLPVDQYVGGIEHAILHLLYARFFNILMHENNLTHNEEPFTKLLTQGMVLADAFYVLDEAGNKFSTANLSLALQIIEVLPNARGPVSILSI